MVNGLPDKKGGLTKADIEYAKINNQFLISGTNPEFKDDNYIVFLEQVMSTSYIIKDSAGTALTGTITSPLNLDNSPLRVDKGIIITGTVLTAKGFYVQKQ